MRLGFNQELLTDQHKIMTNGVISKLRKSRQIEFPRGTIEK